MQQQLEFEKQKSDAQLVAAQELADWRAACIEDQGEQTHSKHACCAMSSYNFWCMSSHCSALVLLYSFGKPPLSQVDQSSCLAEICCKLCSSA